MSVKSDIERLEKRTGAQTPGTVAIYRDKDGNTIAPQGQPEDAQVLEVCIGGIDLGVDI